MNLKRGDMSIEDLEAIFGTESDLPKPDVFDLGALVVLSELTDDELLFRESIIKTFFESATRAGHPVYGFTIEVLERLHSEVVAEFKNRGRDYLPTLDRHQKSSTKDIKRGAKGTEEITVKVKEPNVQELIQKTAEKVAEEIVRKSPVNTPTFWTYPNPINYPGGSTGDVYYGHNYTTSNDAGGNGNEKTGE